MNKIQIYPRKVEVFGHERSSRPLESVVSIMVGMTEGDKIPAVKLITFDGGETYELIQDKLGVLSYYKELKDLSGCDGGHRRALAAYYMGYALDAEIIEYSDIKERLRASGRVEIPEESIMEMIRIPRGERRPLSHIGLRRNPDEFVFEIEDMNKKYRELPEPEVFCKPLGRYNKARVALKSYGYIPDQKAYTKMRNDVLKLMSSQKIVR
jgi:hypothetical protein